MTIDRITGEDLSQVRSGLQKFSPLDWDAQLKFVLLLSTDSKGFLRADVVPEHTDVLARFHQYLREHGEDPTRYQLRGGGFVDVYHSQNPNEKTRLSFHGLSRNFGRFDEPLLRQTLDEVVNREKFSYNIR